MCKLPVTFGGGKVMEKTPLSRGLPSGLKRGLKKPHLFHHS